MRTAGQRLRVTAQLINVGDSSHLWSERYDRQMEDVFAIQDEISGNIVDALRVRLVGEGEGRRLEKRHTDDVEAYHLYLKGQHNWYRRESDSLQKAASFFEKAARKDPGYALAHVGLANAYSSLGLLRHGAGPGPGEGPGRRRPRARPRQGLGRGPRRPRAAADVAPLGLGRGRARASSGPIRGQSRRRPRPLLVRLPSRLDRALPAGPWRWPRGPWPWTRCRPTRTPAWGCRCSPRVGATTRSPRSTEPSRWTRTSSTRCGSSVAAYSDSSRHDEAVAVLERAVTLSGARLLLPELAGPRRAARRGAASRPRASSRSSPRGPAPRMSRPRSSRGPSRGSATPPRALTWVEKACEERNPPLAMHQDTLLRGLHRRAAVPRGPAADGTRDLTIDRPFSGSVHGWTAAPGRGDHR